MATSETKFSLTANPILKGGIGVLSVNIVGLVLGFGLQLYLARCLSPEVFGGYQYIISWLSVLVILAAWGMDGVAFRFVAAYLALADHSRLAGLLVHSSRRAVMASCWLTVGLMLIARFFPQAFPVGLSEAMVIGALILPFWAIANLAQSVIASLKSPMRARIPDLVVRPLLLAGGITFWMIYDRALDIEIVIFIAFIVSVITSLVFVFLAHKSLPNKLFSFDRTFEKPEWRSVAIALMGISVLNVVMSQCDVLLLGYLGSIEDVAVYSVALRISQLVVFGFQAVNLVSAPIISELYAAKKTEELQQTVASSTRASTLLALPVFIGLCLFGKFVLGYFGLHYATGFPVLIILGFAQLSTALMATSGYVLTMSGNQMIVIHILIRSLILNVVLNIPLVLTLGITGAAIATGSAIILSNVMMTIKAFKLVKIDASFGMVAKRYKEKK